ncbi:hypothetical protein [Nocardia jinanensis]|uniref:Uncharacterized protein n=1 Tax=Nocardia jinanensis TaxID=382504 RepID=A0A917VW89_9NOCA|nr:hypothetical protein [Nocardia jinanensis]GGL20635.1 hypothetical protein GCM10011588_39360 [Nocardia jinanensis]
MTAPNTVSALVDFAHIPPGGTELVHHLDEVEIPLVTDPDDCDHQDSICPDCAHLWKPEHLFAEPLPWDHDHPDNTGP